MSDRVREHSVYVLGDDKLAIEKEAELTRIAFPGTPPTEIYVALNSVPDYHGPAPSFRSAHATLEGAIAALYPKDTKFHSSFRPSPYSKNVWDGPDGFGEVRKVEVLP